MEPDAVAFGILDHGHVAILRRYLGLWNQYLATGGFYFVEHGLYIGICVEIEQGAVRHGGFVKSFAITKGTTNGRWIIDGEHPHLDVVKIQRGQGYSEDCFIKFLGPVQIRRGDFKPADCVTYCHGRWIVSIKILSPAITFSGFVFFFLGYYFFPSSFTLSYPTKLKVRVWYS